MIKIKSKYKHIYQKSATSWQASIQRKLLRFRANFTTEKDAAIAVDKFLIKNGLDPVNILKSKEI